MITHLLESQDPAGSKRKSVAKCGHTVKHGKTERCDEIIAWWNDVTCHECRRAGLRSIAYATERRATDAAAAAEPEIHEETGTLEPRDDATSAPPSDGPSTNQLEFA